MIDIFNLPNNDNNFDIFTARGINFGWQTWTKPKNAKFIQILAIGGGGGGGAGWGAFSNSGSGGGGGGSGAISSGIFPANVLPDTLYVMVGTGGAGGSLARGSNGSNGTATYVAITNTVVSAITLNEVLLLANGGNAGSGGLSSISTPGAAGGTGGAISSDTLFGKLGVNSYYSGQAGANGGFTTPTSGSSITIANIVTGGAGGGGLTTGGVGTNGGNINGAGIVPLVSGGTSGTTPTQCDASSGYSILPSINSSNKMPMVFTGGAGGGAHYIATVGTGGYGGNGAYGCGGGGGGPSNYSTTSYGYGGNGGNGLVIITTW